MECKRYVIGDSNTSARDYLRANLNFAANSRTLSRKLIDCLKLEAGAFELIALEGLELERITDYSLSQQYDGKVLSAIPRESRASAVQGLVLFLTDYLATALDGMVVVENWMATRESPHLTPESRTKHQHRSRLAFYHDEVFHVLTKVDTDLDVVDDTIREPWHRWFTGVCADRLTFPANGEITEMFLDELVSNTQHIFAPALDDEAFLVWSS